MSDLLILVGAGLGTYALRAAFLVTAGRRPPAPLAHVLPYIGPAVLAAIVAPALIAPHQAESVAAALPALVAAAVTWLLWRRTRSRPGPLFGGLAVALLLAAVLA
jgi:branched chain amino acid efflux pump